MPMNENELIERDRKRDLGAELLESVREMVADRRGREYRVDPATGTVQRSRTGASAGLDVPREATGEGLE